MPRGSKLSKALGLEKGQKTDISAGKKGSEMRKGKEGNQVRDGAAQEAPRGKHGRRERTSVSHAQKGDHELSRGLSL